jgi:gamma-glutamyltranspeptidase/glutathione hydrolase
MEVITMPPPSSGGVALLETLAVLDGFSIEAERRAQAQSSPAGGAPPARVVHWWIEALRLAFMERALHMGDPDFVDVPLQQLLAPEWVARARVSIGEMAGAPSLSLAEAREGQETTHVSVLDRQGNAVSLTTTINSTFGSGILVRGAGFLLNNEIDDFSLQPGVPNQFGLIGGTANAIAPGKRPLSSMTPTVLRRGGGSVALVLGSPGGPRIITSVLSVIVRTMLFGETLATAVAAPRFHQQWAPSATDFEPGWPPELLEALSRRGHTVRAREQPWGRVQAIQVLPDGAVEGVSDPRAIGAAVAVKH